MAAKKNVWSAVQKCPADHWIAAASARNVPYKGMGRLAGDDTGIEGLRFKCVDEDMESEQIIEYTGDAGEWKNWSTQRDGHFVSEAMAMEDMSGGDDWSGLTGLKFHVCKP